MRKCSMCTKLKKEQEDIIVYYEDYIEYLRDNVRGIVYKLKTLPKNLKGINKANIELIIESCIKDLNDKILYEE